MIRLNKLHLIPDTVLQLFAVHKPLSFGIEAYTQRKSQNSIKALTKLQEQAESNAKLDHNETKTAIFFCRSLYLLRALS